ncbi:MAG: translation initiation factor IF-2 [Firmicutes bacterium]|nr:translation initiation factor IF-2 [Bacillota bacterium]
MDKTNQEQTQKQGVSFLNLKTLAQINSDRLAKMNREIKRVITQVDGVAKTVRDNLRSISAVPIKEESVAAPVVQAVTEPVKPEAVQPKPEVKTERREFNNQAQQSRGFQPRQQAGGRDGRPPFQPRDNRGFQPREGAQGYNNQNRQPRAPYGQGGFNQNRNTGGTTFQGGARPPYGAGRPAFGTKPERPTESYPMTQKKVFDVNANKRKDYDKYNKDGDKFNKRAQARRGLAEEASIEERIMGSRKIKFKKAKDHQVVHTVIDKAIITTENVSVKTLAEKTGKPVSEILKQLMVLGVVSNINSVIDFATCELVAGELGIALEQKIEKSYEEKLADEFAAQKKGVGVSANKRPPIITVLGHVDHGKTSLLDYIRKANVTASESGGITQHIGAYQIEKNGQKITFIDTPGHAAFSAMRARGASVTDIAVLVVAADDGIKPQTREAIKHIKDAKVPMIVAVNKMDKPEANLEKVKTQLTEEGILPEEWGGDTVIVPVSALTGLGVDKLIEMVLLLADLQELSADVNERALGMVIEAKLDKGKGPVATLIVLNGTLKVGDTIISGLAVGKVRAMLDSSGKNIKQAPPSAPVSVLGLDQVPNAGDTLYAADEAMSKKVLQERMRKVQTDKLVSSKSAFSIEDFLSKSADSEKKVLNLIVKADVQGSFEALTLMLNEVQNSEVRVECIHGGVGTITESDVMLAKSSGAIIIGFNTKPSVSSAELADTNKIKIYQYRIIYEALDEVSKIIKGMRTPVYQERVLGHATVIRLFKISKIGTVAGCIVNDGKITKNSKIRLFRGKDKIAETGIATLQREKNDVKEVLSGFDMGIKLEGWNDIELDDRLESYIMEQVELD